MARPGGNITGFTQFEYSLSGKWLELLKEIVPRVTRAAVIRGPTRGPRDAPLGALRKWRPDRDDGRNGLPPGRNHSTCGAASLACGLSLSLLDHRWRPCVVWP